VLSWGESSGLVGILDNWNELLGRIISLEIYQTLTIGRGASASSIPRGDTRKKTEFSLFLYILKI